MDSVHPAQRCTSPLGVVPAGLGDGVGDCHDVAELPRGVFFYFPCVSLLGEQRDMLLLFQEYVLWDFMFRWVR